MTSKAVIRCLLTLLICLPLSAATYYVRKDGNDSTNDGLSDNSGGAWLTIGKAASVVNPGDTVYVRQGTYQEYVRLTRSGSSGQPITWIGERDGDDWLTIIDNTQPLSTSGWTQATGDFTGGSYAWKKAITRPHLITYNGRSLMEIAEVRPQDRVFLGYAPDRRHIPSMWPYEEDWFDGVSAYWMWYDNYVYLRFQDGSSPAGKTLRANSTITGVQMRGVSYNVLQHFHIRGARWSIWLYDNVDNCTIAHCLIEQGFRSILANGGHQYNITIMDNTMRGQHYIDDLYGARDRDYPETATQHILYLRNKFMWGGEASGGTEGSAIFLVNPGVNVVMTNNVITDNAGAMFLIVGNNRPDLARNASGLVFADNLITNMVHALLLEAGFGAINIRSNTVINAHHPFRVQNLNVIPNNDSPYYIYGNVAANANAMGGCLFHIWPNDKLYLIGNPDTTASLRQEMFFYHNTFHSMRIGFELSDLLTDTSGGLPRLHVLNNIINTTDFARRGIYGSTSPMRPSGYWGAVDHNAVRQHVGVINDYGSNNVTLSDWEWSPASIPGSFTIATNSAARAAGVDVSSSFVVDGGSFSALPGYTAGYFEALAPDAGALQYFSLSTNIPPTYPYVSITAPDDVASEATGETATFTVSRTETTTGTLTVNYTVTGTATSGTDYDSLGTSITLADGASSTNLTVTPVTNSTHTGPLTVTVTLGPDAAYLLRSPTTATITIVDGDLSPSSLIRQRPQPGQSPATRSLRL